MRRLVRAALLPLAAAAALVTTALPAHAAQQQNANVYVSWAMLPAPSVTWNMDQNIQVRQKASATFWASIWKWSNDSQHGGYFGLQTDGSRFDGTTGDTAIFSIWNANGSRGATCGDFGHEGNGLSCRVPYTIRTDRMYRLRLWRQEYDGLGQWWGAWIKDQATGIETSIGGLRAPTGSTSMAGYQNFTEYFGPAVTLPTQVPRSICDFTQPAANSQGGGYYESIGNFAGYTQGTGTTATVQVVDLGWTRAARVTMGG
jgi:hypothetical protein